MTTVRSIIATAFKLIGVVGSGRPMSAEEGEDGLLAINQILSQWSLMPLTIPAIEREIFPLEAGRGGPSDPYTIGPGGDFETSRPTSISNVGLLVTNVVQPFEITRTVYTDDAYASIVQKELTSNYFTGIYFAPTFADGLATIQLWPVPADDNTSLVLYRPVQLREFENLNDEYDFPPGAVSALQFQLAKWLAPQYGQPWPGHLEQLCNQSMAVYQRANTVMADLGLDPALTAQGGVYNILSDSSSGFQGR